MDFEGYFVKKKFIIKEIAFFNYFLNTYENFFIKTKNYFNKETKWCINHYHKIPCNYGNTSFSLINKIFQNSNIIFLVNGPEKLKILSNFTKNIIIDLRNIFDTSILAEPINRIKCQLENHTENKHCALFKVQKLSLICDFKQETLI